MTRLRDVVRDFAAREEQLTRSHRIQLGTLRRQREEAGSAQMARFAEERGRIESEFALAGQQLQARIRQRHERLQRAHRNAHARRLELANELEGRAKFKWQRGHLEANRQRDADLKAAEEAHAAFNAELGHELEHLSGLEAAAHHTLGGYGSLTPLLEAADSPVSAADSKAEDHHQSLAQLRTALDRAAADHQAIRKRVLPVLFTHVPPWLWAGILAVPVLGAVPLLPHAGVTGFTWTHAGLVAGAVAVVVFILYFLGRSTATDLARKLGTGLHRAHALHAECVERATAHHAAELQRVQAEFDRITRQLEADWSSAQNTARNERATLTVRLGQKAKALMERAEATGHRRMDDLKRRRQETLRALAGETGSFAGTDARGATEDERAAQVEHETKLAALAADWLAAVQPVYQVLDQASAGSKQLFPAWDDAFVANWTPAAEFAHAAPLATLEVTLETLAGTLPKSEPLKLPGPAEFTAPLLLTLPEQGSVLFETRGAGREEAIATLNNLVQRLLAVAPPGKLNFTLLDPSELGQSFAGLMHLADYEDRLINSRIWTQTPQIEEQLGLLNEHIEKVAQMYLRNEYQTITEYNLQAGRIAEKYHFLVVADFPVNFSEVAVRRVSDAALGPASAGPGGVRAGGASQELHLRPKAWGRVHRG